MRVRQGGPGAVEGGAGGVDTERSALFTRTRLATVGEAAPPETRKPPGADTEGRLLRPGADFESAVRRRARPRHGSGARGQMATGIMAAEEGQWQYLTSPPPPPEWDEYWKVRAAAYHEFFAHPHGWRHKLSTRPGSVLAVEIDCHLGLLEAAKLGPTSYTEENAKEAFELALQYADLLRTFFPESPPLPDRWEPSVRAKLLQMKEWCRRASRCQLPSSPPKTEAFQILLRRMFEVAVPAAKSRKGISSRKRLPNPNGESLLAGYRRLQQMSPEEKLSIEKIGGLYGLGGVDALQFSNSSKYVQGSRQPRRPWRLPYVPGRARKRRDPKTKAFISARWWTAAEVMCAFQGWASKVGMKLPARF